MARTVELEETVAAIKGEMEAIMEDMRTEIRSREDEIARLTQDLGAKAGQEEQALGDARGLAEAQRLRADGLEREAEVLRQRLKAELAEKDEQLQELTMELVRLRNAAQASSAPVNDENAGKAAKKPKRASRAASKPKVLEEEGGAETVATRLRSRRRGAKKGLTDVTNQA